MSRYGRVLILLFSFLLLISDSTAQSQGSVSVYKTGPASVTAGANIVYTITVKNNGTEAVTLFDVFDDLPENTTFVSASDGGILEGPTVFWAVEFTLNPGERRTFSLTVKAPNEAGTVVNERYGAVDANNQTYPGSAVSTNVTSGGGGVTVTKTGPSAVAAGGTIDYSIAVVNGTGNNVEIFEIQDQLPPNVTFISGAPNVRVNNGVVSWVVYATLPPNGRVDVSYSVRAPNTAATITNENYFAANLSGTRYEGSDKVVTTVAGGVANLVLSKSGPSFVNVGSNIIYTLNVTNTGTAPAQIVDISDAVPANTTFVSASFGGELSGGVVRWAPNSTLAPGGKVTLYSTVKAPDTPGTVTSDTYSVTDGDQKTIAGNKTVTTQVLPQGSVGINRIEVNQVLGIQLNNNDNYVAGKPTVIRAHLSAQTTIDPAQTEAAITRDGQAVATLKPKSYGRPVNVVEFLCPTLAACGSWAAGKYTINVKVNGVSKNTSGRTIQFQTRRSLRVLSVPLVTRIKGQIYPIDNDAWKTAGRFMQQVYPVAKIEWIQGNSLTYTTCDLEGNQSGATPCQYNLWKQLKALQCPGGDQKQCYDVVLGFGMQNPPGLAGVTYGLPAAFVSLSADYQKTVAHEIGHIFGLGDTYDKGSFQCQRNPAPDEFSSKKGEKCNKGKNVYSFVFGNRVIKLGTLVPAAHFPYEVGGRGVLGDSSDYMGTSVGQNKVWTTQENYDVLYKGLAPKTSLAAAELDGPERFLSVAGTIDRDFSVELDPWYSFQDTVPAPDSSGPFVIRALDGSGKILASQSLGELNFLRELGREYVELASIPFNAVIRFPAGTARFVIVKEGTVLREIPVSANAPTVSDVTPSSSQTVDGEFTISWTGNDADGDSLVYTVEYNADVTDENSPWITLAVDINETQWEEDFSFLPGGDNAQIEVFTSDGVHGASGMSAQFVTPKQKPDVFIYEPEFGYSYAVREEILLEADAYDVQLADWIPDDQIVWTSDKDGQLGSGAYIVVSSLSKGDHLITATATDSDGQTSSDAIDLSIGSLAFQLVEAPAAEDIVVATDSNGLSTRVTIPRELASSQDLYLEVADEILPIEGTAPAGFRFADRHISLFVEQYDSVQDAWSVLTTPGQGIPVTITYGDLPEGVTPESLLLYRWDEENQVWVDAAADCTPAATYDRTTPGQIGVTLCHLSDFSLVAPSGSGGLHLPLIRR